MATLNIRNKDGTFVPLSTLQGDPGERGHGILKVTTAPTSYTTAAGGKNPIKRMSIATIKSQAKVDEVLVGDQISYSYYLYNIYYLDATYAYMDTYQSIRGATGAKGDDGDTGPAGDSGVHVGSEPPTGGQNVWINPTGEPDGEVSGGVQPDWNQTDETAPDFIRNRPFSSTSFIIADEQTVVFEEGMGFAILNVSANIGDVVTVVWDGVEYTCQAYDSNGLPVIGNIGIFGGDDTGEPFIIALDAEQPLVVPADMEKTSVVLHIVGENVDKIDAKYLPDKTVTAFYIDKDNQKIYNDNAYTDMSTHAKVVEALDKNNAIFKVDDTFVNPTHVSTGAGYAGVTYMWRNGAGEGEYYTAFTAEYYSN